MKLTCITVCLNSEKTIERTFLSVLNQTKPIYEYLVIDGVSTDKTLDIVKKYQEKFKEKKIIFKTISEKDNGLYDAMNKAVLMARGDYLIFMNSDDTFFQNDVIQKAEPNLDNDVIYGNSVISFKNKKEEMRISKDINAINQHLPFIPQSCFVKTCIQKQFLFNTNYKISADYDSYLRMYQSGIKFKKIDLTISRFYYGGISNKNEWNTYKEDIKVKLNHGVLKRNIFLFFRILRRWIIIKLKGAKNG